MAENNDFEDEYQFSDADVVGNDFDEVLDDGNAQEKISSMPLESVNIRRNALIAVGLIILIVIVYKVASSFFSTPKPVAKPITPIVKAPKPTIAAPVSVAAPTTTAQTPSVLTNQRVNNQLSSLQSNQQTLQANVSDVNNQVSNLNDTINNLSQQVEQLNRSLSIMASKYEEQGSDLQRLVKQLEQKKKRTEKKARVRRPQIRYQMQAVIPGRAWLISSEGSTLTVRVGTNIPNYGSVKLIDPQQGYVLTSSGKVIRFSQEDS